MRIDWILGMRRARGAGLMALLLVVAGCDEETTRPVARPPAEAVAEVQVTAERTMLDVGTTTQASAAVLNAGRQPLAGRPVAWSSGDTAVAVVDGRGTVTARGGGTVAISATSGGRTGTVWLSVAAPAVHEVRIDPVDLVLEVGQSRRLTARALTAGGVPIAGRPVRWHTTDPASVAVDAEGRVMARAPGVQVVNAEIDGTMDWVRITVPPDLGGRWTLWAEVEGNGTRCWLRGPILTFGRDGLTFRGEAEPGEGGTSSGCQILPGGTPPFSTPAIPNGPFAGRLFHNLQVARLDVELAFEWDRWRLEGAVYPGSMNGAATLIETVDGREVVRRGSWMLQRVR